MARKILIADQSETVREVAESLFRTKGFEVMSASDGTEALELARMEGVDLAFLNSSLPEIDGYAVSEQIKSDDRTQEVKVVLLLSTAEIVDQRKLLSSLADDTLNKPFSPQDLVDTTAAVLNVDIEPVSDKEEELSEHEVIGDDIEELSLTEDADDEMDFDSIFAGDEKGEDDMKLDSVFLTEDQRNESEDNPEQPSVSIDNAGKEAGYGKVLNQTDRDSEESIRLADDQYGMDGQAMEPEIEKPHDYNWFINEMKKDLGASGSGPQSPEPKASKRSETPMGGKSPAIPGDPMNTTSTGQFDVEEIGTSRVPVPTKEYKLPIPISSQSSGSKHADSETDSAKLALAEKLLIKELANRISEKLIQRLSSDELRSIVREAISSLEKM